MKRKVIFIRHGESLANVDSSYYQNPDAAVILTQRGVDQCLKLMETFPSILPDDFYGIHTQVITSEYVRAKLTANIVTAKVKFQLPFVSDARANETYHSEHDVCEEDDREVQQRVLSLIESYPFHLVIFCHGMLMKQIDPQHRHALNCDVRIYDRVEIINHLRKTILLR